MTLYEGVEFNKSLLQLGRLIKHYIERSENMKIANIFIKMFLQKEVSLKREVKQYVKPRFVKYTDAAERFKPDHRDIS